MTGRHPDHRGGQGGDHGIDHDHESGHGRTSGHGQGHGHGHGRGPGLWGRLTDLLSPHSHDVADSVDSALQGSAEGIRAVKISLAVLAVTAGAQAVLVVVTGSTALLADTIHNISDALTAIPLWIAFVLSRRAATQRYTYGYGRAEDLAGVFIVAMIAVSAAIAGYTSLDRLVSGAEISHPWVVAFAGVVGFVGNELVAGYRLRVGRRVGSAALVADGLHARTDGFASLAVVLGAVGVLLGFPLADPIIGLLITAAILWALRNAAVDIFHRLMDSVDPSITADAERTLHETPGVLALEHLRLRWIGHRMSAEAGIVVAADLDLISAHDIANEAHHRLLHGVPKLDDVTIHVSPNGLDGRGHHDALQHHASGAS